MRKWRVNGAILALVLGGSLLGCARSLWSELPVPRTVEPLSRDQIERIGSLCLQKPIQKDGAVDWDCSEPRAVILMGLPEEPGYRADVVISTRLWQAIETYVEALRSGYCEGRSTIQIANGGDPEGSGVCGGP